jgi:hypothetical protein
MQKPISESKIVKAEGATIPVDVTITQLGRFTHAKAVCRYLERVYCAEGLSRRSYLDKPNNAKAQGIAEGRALKALALKIEGKRVNKLMMA